jgi:putative ABC transport system substrate-binding protein
VPAICLITGLIQAQQVNQVPRVGFLISSSPVVQPHRLEAFKTGLQERGYIAGQNILIEVRSGDGQPERLAAAAAELVRLKVDIIVTGGPSSTLAAKAATNSIPILMTLDNDPVGEGVVTSLARPSGNITGLATFGPELWGKRLELLKETVRNLSRVAMFTSSARRPIRELKEVIGGAQKLGIQLREIQLRSDQDIEAALQNALKGKPEALLPLSAALFLNRRADFAELTVKNRLPAIYSREEFVEAGGLMHYAPSTSDLSRRAATFVDKILKGAKPADLPVEQPTKFEFVINLKAAKQIGLTIPPNVLARADKVIR